MIAGDYENSLAAVNRLPARIKFDDALLVLATNYLALKDTVKLKALLPRIKKVAVSDPALATQAAEVFRNAKMIPEAFEILQTVIRKNILITLFT